MLGEPILIGRDEAGGALRVARYLSTPRHAAVSAGHFDGREIECCYHGWRFDTAGDAPLIPSLVPGQELRPRPNPYPPLSGPRSTGQHLGVFRRGPGGCTGHPGARRVRRRAPDLVETRAVRRGDRSCRGRADGPGARAVRASCLVVALAPLDPGKGEGIRALPFRFHDDPPRAVAQFAGLPAPGRRARDRDRLPAAERADRAYPRRPPPGDQPDRDHPDRRPGRPRSTTASIGPCPGSAC